MSAICCLWAFLADVLADSTGAEADGEGQDQGQGEGSFLDFHGDTSKFLISASGKRVFGRLPGADMASSLKN